MTSFNLVSDAWIPVVNSDGTTRFVGVREALLDAHNILRVTIASPLAEVAVHRLLLAVLHRALDGPQDVSLVIEIYEKGQLPRDPIESYLERWEYRFDLFDPTYPFYQVPDLPTDSPSPWTRLLPEFASGNNPTLFDHTLDDNPPPASPPEAALALLVHQSFTPGGLIRRLGVTSGKAGPLSGVAVFLPQGSTLFETLLLNLCEYSQYSSDGGQPIWEREPYGKKDVEGGKAREMLSGRTRIYTWMSRAVLLLPEHGGQIRKIAYGPGIQPEKSPELDPMLAYLKSKGQVLPYQLSRERSFWRDFEALLPVRKKWQPPLVLEHARELLMEMGRTSQLFPLVVAGQITDQAKVLDVRREVYPLAARILEPKSESVSCILKALESARDTGTSLEKAARDLADKLLPTGTEQDKHRFVQSLPLHLVYWSSLERRFPQFLTELNEQGPQEALKGWQDAVHQAARDAWKETANAVGTGPRHLRAIAEGERCLRYSLEGRAT